VTTSTTTLTTVTVRYFAAARAAAGAESEILQIPAGSSVDDTIVAVRERHGAELARVLDRCSFLLDEVAVRDRTLPVPDGALLDVLPPFAGG
jgi:molybdopterin converting factor small subunit